jgi:glycosyltransferase involved in cell wall biosynthesis
LKVVFVYRPTRSGAHSIETVFRAVSAAMSDDGVEVVDYVLSGRRGLSADVADLRRLQADIYHVTGDVYYVAAMLPSAKTVLTVHDIGHYLHDLSGWRKIVYRWVWLSLPMRRAAEVTVSSAATAEAVRRHLGEIGMKARLVELCYSPLFVPIPKAFDGVCPKILQVGTGHNKNALRIVQALEGIDCELIIVGRVTPELQRELESRRVRYQSRVDVPQAEMVQLYADVDIVAFVSLNEGFGMPIIEAQVMGKALITSDCPPMSEVAGAQACLVDPEDVRAIRAGILRLIEDEDYRVGVVRSGLRNVERFSPPSVAACFRRVYEDVLDRA